MSTRSLSRREFIQALGAAAAVTAVPHWGRSAETQPRPNIVLIYADDLDFDEAPGYDTATMPCAYAQQQAGKQGAVSGHRLLMPNIARLVDQGARFDRLYVTSSVCTPSRYGLLTGRYASRCPTFLQRNPAGKHATIRWNTPLKSNETNIAKALKAAGYTTGAVGKWHNFPWLDGALNSKKHFAEDADPRAPDVAAALKKQYELARSAILSCGFEYAESIHIGNTEELHPKALRGHNPEWVAAGARRFIEQHRAEPFFLYMPLTLPHGKYYPRWMREADPLAVTHGMLKSPPDSDMPSRDEMFRRVREAGLDKRLAVGTWLDECVGAVMRKLDELRLTENTLILFISDHQAKGKYTCYESCRVPAIASWPGHIAPGHKVTSLCANVDLGATLLEAVGGECPEDMSDGRSFLPMLLGRPEPKDWRESLLLEVGNTRAAVTRRWKYIANRVPADVARKMADDAEEARRVGRRPMVGWDGAENWHPWQQKTGGIVYNSDAIYPCYFHPDQLYDLQADALEGGQALPAVEDLPVHV